MWRISIIVFFYFLGIQNIHAKKNGYPANTIPEALKSGADAIVRLDSTFLDIKESGYKMSRKLAVTVLNEKGNREAIFRVFYDSYSKVSDISGKLYDAEGELVKSLNNNQILDASTFGSSYVFYDDNRLKVFDFDHKQYPYTVVYEYDYKCKTNFFVPSWLAQPDEKVAVEKAVLQLSSVVTAQPKFKAYNFPKGALHEELRKDSIWVQKWTLEQIPAFVHQPSSITENYYLPTLEIVVDKIALSTYNGSTESWQSLGKFIYELNKGKDELPAEIKQKLHAMTDTIPDTRAKVAYLYHYMQQHTRYVANEYGLSGWQTFDASGLSKSGYGDCKGLSNYMKALLKAIDIPANLVAISAGGDKFYKLDRAFSSNVFNHMILCVPMEKDSIWLECTSSVLPAGYLGSFTQDRDALLLGEDGGRIVRTPAYNKRQNGINREISLSIDPGKEVQEVTWNSIYKGTRQDNVLSYLRVASDDKIRERITGLVPYKSVDIEHSQYSYSDPYDSNPYIKEAFTLGVPNLINETAKRMMINIPVMGNPMSSLQCNVARTKPIVLEDDYILEYRYKITLPEGARLEAIPATVKVDQPFARYAYTATLKDNVLTILVTFEQNKGVYEASLFESYQAMYNKLSQYSNEISLSVLK